MAMFKNKVEMTKMVKKVYEENLDTINSIVESKKYYESPVVSLERKVTDGDSITTITYSIVTKYKTKYGNGKDHLFNIYFFYCKNLDYYNIYVYKMVHNVDQELVSKVFQSLSNFANTLMEKQGFEYRVNDTSSSKDTICYTVVYDNNEEIYNNIKNTIKTFFESLNTSPNEWLQNGHIHKEPQVEPWHDYDTVAIIKGEYVYNHYKAMVNVSVSYDRITKKIKHISVEAPMLVAKEVMREAETVFALIDPIAETKTHEWYPNIIIHKTL